MVITEHFDDGSMHQQNIKDDLKNLEEAFKNAGYQTFSDPKSMSFDGRGNRGNFNLTASRYGNPRQIPEVLVVYSYKVIDKRGELEIKVTKSVDVCVYSQANREEQATQTEVVRTVVLPLIERVVGEQSNISVNYRYPNPEIKVSTIKEDTGGRPYDIQEDGDSGIPEKPGAFDL